MSQFDLIIFTSIVLFVTFCLGWLAHLLIAKLGHKFEKNQTGEHAIAVAFHKSEAENANIVDKLKERDAELTNKLAQAKAELSATMDGLHNARIEIESLREKSKKPQKNKK
tara:strand:- start:1148 stop:1480 length:333 start_codon:yes stop_codon:yes gene_type:complete